MKITFEFTDAGDDGHDETTKAKRMMRTDDAFMLIWEITNIIDRHNNNKDDLDVADHAVCSEATVLDDINDVIRESNLLELWQ